MLEIFYIFLRLGCISFGGPAAHIGYFKEAFVTRRNWLSESRFSELLGLCQFVPGPSSSQLGFAIGWHRGGLTGAAAAWLGFTLPSALIMIAVSYGLVTLGAAAGGLIDGMLIAAVAVVAHASASLRKTLCPDVGRLLLAAISAALLLLIHLSWMPLVVLFIGFSAGNLFYRNSTESKIPTSTNIPIKGTIIYGCLLSFTVLLVASLFVNSSAEQHSILAAHYQAGALVFGGGHVVLPLLEQTLVPEFLTEENFLAGYSAAQALPGPLFTLSAYLGTAGSSSQPVYLTGIATLLAIFLPGILLLVGLLPFWNRLKNQTWAQAGIKGANAAVVGLLFAALINPVIPHGIHSKLDAVTAAAGFIALYRFKLPAWSVVLACGLIGIWSTG